MRKALIVATLLIVTTATVARADDPKMEIGASLAGTTIGLGKNDFSTFGVPSGGFTIVQPGVYASIFAGPYLAIEPQLGLIWVSSNGHSDHILDFVGQLDYFAAGTSVNSAYFFGAAGILDTSSSATSPKSLSAGLGYRIVAGDRLTFRVDGRITHLTEGGGNMLAFGLTIGGIFR